MMLRLHVLAVAFVLFVVTGGKVNAQDSKEPEPKISERRRHFVIKAKDATSFYEGSEINRTSDVATETHVLVRDEGHGDFVLHRTWNFKTQTVQHRISDVKDRAFFQVSYKMPFTARTRAATLEEAKSNPTILPQVNTLFTLETNGGTWAGSEAEWDADPVQLRSLRHSVRSTMDRFVLEAIERGRTLLFSTAEGEPFWLVKYVLYDKGTPEEEAAAAPDAAPDCDFDAAFGFPCSEKQKTRVRKAAEDGAVPVMY